MDNNSIKTALISVYHKDGLEDLLFWLDQHDIEIYSTGGTQKFIENLGYSVKSVESLTSYPSILDGRVKTLHPKVFGGILAKREEDHLGQLEQLDIPTLDLVIVDLYPFEETLAKSSSEDEIIEKIDIGGISLIRAAAKNYRHNAVISSKNQYRELIKILSGKTATTSLEQRRKWAAAAYLKSSQYDTHIFSYMNRGVDIDGFGANFDNAYTLKYGENPHQKAKFFGKLDEVAAVHGQKKLGYNNILDVNAAIRLMFDFRNDKPTFAILKHTNTCGIATRNSLLQAWKDALAGDPISAFGGILVSNVEVGLNVAQEINTLFYEVLIAPKFTPEAKEFLLSNKRRILVELKSWEFPNQIVRGVLNGMLVQDADLIVDTPLDLVSMTTKEPNQGKVADLLFAMRVAKHLKSNTIVLAKNLQLIGIGCGQTSRVDACNQAIEKAGRMGFNTKEAVMASDAFFPFPDCVELAHRAEVNDIIQPGGSKNDQLSIDYCNAHGMTMVKTGNRHFKH